MKASIGGCLCLQTSIPIPTRGLGFLASLVTCLMQRSVQASVSTDEIFGQAEPADYIYQVIEAAVRSHKLLSDGRRQIGAFHLPGDIFGLENGVFHRFTAEAIADTTVRLVKRQSLERVAKTDPAMVRSLLTMTTDNLQHVENHLLLLGRQSATERVGRDIADYLGLTIETVSRALSAFHRKG